MDPRQIDLIEGFLDDSLSAGELQQLLHLVRTEAAFKEEFRSALRMRGLVESVLHADPECEQLADAVRKAIGPDDEARSFETRVMEKIDAPKPEKSRKPTRHWLRKSRQRTIPGGGTGFLIAAALLLAFVGVVAVSTSSPAPRPAPRQEAPRLVRTPEPQDPNKDYEDILREQERLVRVREEQRRLEQEHLQLERELERLDRERREQEAARQRAADLKREQDRAQADAELRRLEEQKQKATLELKKTEETQRRTETPATAKVIAHVENVQGKVFIVDGSSRTPARARETIVSGQAIETEGRDARIIVRFIDRTWVELQGDTKTREVTESFAEGKRVHLLQGSLTAEVQKQPAGRPMIVSTPQANAQVLGTTLRLIVDARETRLEVTKGSVKLTRLEGKSATVTTGQFAVASAGAEPVAKALPKVLLNETFEEPRTVDRNWKLLFVGRDVSAALKEGKLDFSLLSGSTQSNTQGEVHSRTPFPPSVRVSLDVEFSHQHPDLLAGFTFIPMESEPRRDNKDGVLFTRAGNRRSINLGTGVNWGWKALQPQANVPAGAPLREQWAMELEGDSARLLVDGKEIFRANHGGKVHPGYYLRLEGTALTGPNLPLGAYVRYDNVRVELLTR